MHPTEGETDKTRDGKEDMKDLSHEKTLMSTSDSVTTAQNNNPSLDPLLCCFHKQSVLTHDLASTNSPF